MFNTPQLIVFCCVACTNEVIIYFESVSLGGKHLLVLLSIYPEVQLILTNSVLIYSNFIEDLNIKYFATSSKCRGFSLYSLLRSVNEFGKTRADLMIVEKEFLSFTK